MILSALAINIGLWLYLYLGVEHTFESIPLHYNIYFGIDLFGPWYRLLIMPLFGVCILLVNGLVALLIIDKEEPLSYSLILGALFCQIFLWAPCVFIARFLAF